MQKCVRTLDIDEVGKTTRHASFFQMCGNFSFGDYFKEGAIPLAWELLTRPVGRRRLRVRPRTGSGSRSTTTTTRRPRSGTATSACPSDRIQRRGLKDNYWYMGVPGPGGPCSEIYYDRGPEYGVEGGPVVDEERYLEVWNLVFMQYALSAVRAKDDFDILGELPAKNIDTGMGLERMAAFLQGVENMYEIDTTRRSSTGPRELTGTPLRRRPRTTTCGCASSPTTPAPR